LKRDVIDGNAAGVTLCFSSKVNLYGSAGRFYERERSIGRRVQNAFRAIHFAQEQVAGFFQDDQRCTLWSVLADQGAPRLRNVGGLGAWEGEWGDLCDTWSGNNHDGGCENENVEGKGNPGEMSFVTRHLFCRPGDMIHDSLLVRGSFSEGAGSRKGTQRSSALIGAGSGDEKLRSFGYPRHSRKALRTSR